MKQLTNKEYKKLASIESAAKRYASTIKKGWDVSLKLMHYRSLWNHVAEELGILGSDGETVKYTTESGKDFSHGYNFGDALA